MANTSEIKARRAYAAARIVPNVLPALLTGPVFHIVYFTVEFIRSRIAKRRFIPDWSLNLGFVKRRAAHVNPVNVISSTTPDESPSSGHSSESESRNSYQTTTKELIDEELQQTSQKFATLYQDLKKSLQQQFPESADSLFL